MKNVIAGLVAVSGLAGTATAATTINFYAWDGAAWVSTVNALPGTTVQCAITIGTNSAVYGLAGGTFNVQGAGLASGGSVDVTSAGLGRQAGFNFAAGTVAAFYSGTNFKIDASTDSGFPGSTAAGIGISQNTPGALGGGFNQSNPALVFKFNITIGAGQANGSDVTFTTTAAQNPRGIQWYLTSASTKGDLVEQLGTINGGTIHVTPAPASLALVGLGGLVAGRRRR